ncbi:MAG: hypothetical protein LBH75_04535, partial [Treponema sp.]|nr:hypothetical protein [Treponema sp.]
MKRFFLILLVVSAVMACRDVETDAPTPAGTGVRIVVGSGERTVIPDASGLYYTLNLTAQGKEAVTGVITEQETEKEFELTPGAWKLEIEGYLSEADAENSQVLPVVKGEEPSITVADGKVSEVKVVLEPVAQALGGSGTFKYEVSFPAGTTTAVLTITPYSGGGGGAEASSINLLEESKTSGEVELNAGYYRIAIALGASEDKTVRQRDIVHIIKDLTTKASYSYTAEDFAEPKPEPSEDQGPETIYVDITAADGWLNAAYVEWNPLAQADSYEVYYKKATGSTYVKADAPLIRKYKDGNRTYYRADVMGIAAGSYDLKVLPVLNEDIAEDYEVLDSVRSVNNVETHDRSGYAFSNGRVPGAYQMDGTPKPNARVIYITNENKDTVTLSVKTGSNKEENLSGLQNILSGFKKKFETRPLIIRLIGQIGIPTTTDKGDIVVDTGEAGATGTSYITIEGVGNDATADGWGIRIKNATNIEVSNLGFMNTAADEGDNVGLQSKNYYVWVHNCDLFYGAAGGDADQAKGDGAMDSKGSTYVTFSYNHFWDNGKTHLIGNKESGPDGNPGLLTIHHNWYDHSDSRHPRVRIHTVHVYNNYYDCVAKYGIGVTYGASVFAEGNYFYKTKNPMLISKQGHDNNTFGGEDGGIIKAYGNSMDSTGSNTFTPYSSNNTDFDAYVVTNRGDTVPSSVKTKQGGHTYSNFDTDSGFYTYTADTAETAKDKVVQYAGRMQGGDFKWTFTSQDETSYAVNTALQSALTSYKTKLVSEQGSTGGDTGGGGTGGDDNPGGGENPGGGGTDPTDPGTGGGDDPPPVTGDSITCYFEGAKTDNASPSNSAFSITNTKSGGKVSYANNKGTITVNGTDY